MKITDHTSRPENERRELEARNMRWMEKAKIIEDKKMSPAAQKRFNERWGHIPDPPKQKPQTKPSGFDDQNLDNLKRQLRIHEGTVFVGEKKCVGGGAKGNMCVYHDHKGIPTIGVGRNLRDNPLTDEEWKKIGGKRDLMQTGITAEESEILLDNDIKATHTMLMQQVPGYRNLDPVRQRAVLDMGFNMGMAKLSGFVTMLKGINLTDANGQWTPDFKMAAANVTGNYAPGYDYQTGKGVYIGKTDYYKDVGYRAENVKAMLESGQDLSDFLPPKGGIAIK
jgi:GH24 family phage-related lysozyme (muramidase)